MTFTTKKDKACIVIGFSKDIIDGTYDTWLVMGDSWIIPAWVNYIIINERTGYGHQLLKVAKEPPPTGLARAYIQVSEQDRVQVGDLLTVMTSTPHTESETRGCECDDCTEGRKDPYNWIVNKMQAQHPPLSDEELSEIFQIIPPKQITSSKETFDSTAFEEAEFNMWYNKYKYKPRRV